MTTKKSEECRIVSSQQAVTATSWNAIRDQAGLFSVIIKTISSDLIGRVPKRINPPGLIITIKVEYEQLKVEKS